MCRRADGSVLVCLTGAALLLTVACEIGSGPRPFSIIPGPAVPSPFPTATLVWDSRAELDIWVNNPVTRGPVPVSLVGEGIDGAIRIEPRLGADGWVLRGPDLDPPADGARTLRIRYRWQPSPLLSPNASRTFSILVFFDAPNSPHAPAQSGASRTLEPAPDWTVADFTHGGGPSLVVRYVYLWQSSANTGVFEIDRIELVK